MLEIAPSAVSQYISGKRGYRIEFEDEVKQSIERLAQDLKEDRVENLVAPDLCYLPTTEGKKATGAGLNPRGCDS